MKCFVKEDFFNLLLVFMMFKKRFGVSMPLHLSVTS